MLNTTCLYTFSLSNLSNLNLNVGSQIKGDEFHAVFFCLFFFADLANNSPKIPVQVKRVVDKALSQDFVNT